MLLVEAGLSLSILTLLGILLLKLALNILQPRQWTLQQSITDAYLTYERAAAERVPFDTLLSAASAWPETESPAPQSVVLGRLPGGHAINGTLYRFRSASPGNVPTTRGAARTAALVNNPAEITTWKLQSILTYRIGKRTYTKSRTVIRSQ